MRACGCDFAVHVSSVVEPCVGAVYLRLSYLCILFLLIFFVSYFLRFMCRCAVCSCHVFAPLFLPSSLVCTCIHSQTLTHFLTLSPTHTCASHATISTHTHVHTQTHIPRKHIPWQTTRDSTQQYRPPIARACPRWPDAIFDPTAPVIEQPSKSKET